MIALVSSAVGTAHRASKAKLFSVILFGVALAFAAVALQPDTASAQVGPSGVECNASGGSGGLTPGEHNVTIAGRPALVYVGSGYDASRPSILSYYLHGDGAADRPFMSSERRALLDNNGWIYVAPQAINNSWASGGVSGREVGNATIESNAQLLEDVFESMFADYNLCRNVLLGSSASGGSWFYDAYFFATRGDRYPAYMDIGCGSSGFDAGWAPFPFYDDLFTFNTNSEILARIKLHYSIGTNDFLYPGAQRSIPFFQSVGFDVTTDIRAGVAHCAYDVDVTAVNWWTDLCEGGFIPVTSRNGSGTIRPESCNASQSGQARCNGRLVTINMNLNSGSGMGTAGVDVILGTPGADVISGLGGDDVICSGGGADTINGGAGADTIYGETGNDTINGGGGADTINGGGGGDNLNGGNGWDRITGSTGNDTITGGNGNDWVWAGPGIDDIDGGPGNDLLLGFDGDDTIVAGPGNDKMNGMNGNDDVEGGDGFDQIWGGLGNDHLKGQGGFDWIWGRWGQDTIDGGFGNDRLYGEGSADTMIGGPGNDLIDGGFGNDSCDGGAGTDTATSCETAANIP